MGGGSAEHGGTAHHGTTQQQRQPNTTQQRATARESTHISTRCDTTPRQTTARKHASPAQHSTHTTNSPIPPHGTNSTEQQSTAQHQQELNSKHQHTTTSDITNNPARLHIKQQGASTPGHSRTHNQPTPHHGTAPKDAAHHTTPRATARGGEGAALQHTRRTARRRSTAPSGTEQHITAQYLQKRNIKH